MRRSELLLLLAWGGSLAAGRDAGGVVLRTQGGVVLRTQDPEAVRALPLETGAARRDLQSSSDACHYVSVSGSTYQTSYHGLWETTGTCSSNSKPWYECIDCSASGQKMWYYGIWWILGYAGCDSGSGGIFSPSDSDGDLAAVSGTWEEAAGGGLVANSEISVKCYAAESCQLVPGTTAKYRCFDCADASASASVGDGQCDAANNVSPCWDGGDCCETTCIDGDTHTCGSYDCKDPDAPPLPDENVPAGQGSCPLPSGRARWPGRAGAHDTAPATE